MYSTCKRQQFVQKGTLERIIRAEPAKDFFFFFFFLGGGGGGGVAMVIILHLCRFSISNNLLIPIVHRCGAAASAPPNETVSLLIVVPNE